MMDYDKFLDWAAFRVWDRYLLDVLAWNDSIGDIVVAGAAIYDVGPLELNRAIWRRVDKNYLPFKDNYASIPML